MEVKAFKDKHISRWVASTTYIAEKEVSHLIQ